MKTSNITLFLMLYIFSVCNLVTSQLTEQHLEDLCDGWNTTKLSLKYIRSGILKASSGQPIDCQVELSPEDGSSVVLSIFKYRLQGDDVLTITDSDNAVISLQGRRDFDYEEKSFTSNGPMLIYFVTNDTFFNSGYLKFQFTFTQVHDGPCSWEFQCRNLNCIPKDLTCDWHNHCGDNSDEAFDLCYTVPTHDPSTFEPDHYTFEPIVIKETRTITILPYIIIGGIVLILIIVIPLTIYGVKKMKKTAKPQPFVQGTGPTQNPTAPALQVPTVPVSELPMVLVMQNPTAPAPTPVAPSAFSRLRQSLRRSKPASQAPTRADQTEMKNYHVPSMYPQIPDASNEAGVENPEFKIEE